MTRNRTCLVIVFLVALAKLIFVASNEIISLPYDSEAYVRQVQGPSGLFVPVGYSVWLGISQALGVPQRLLIELLFIFSTLFLYFCLKKNFGGIAAIVAYVVLLVSPATYFMFDAALSDGFFACLNIVGVALSLQIISGRELPALRWSAFGLGLIFGWMAITRNEDILLLIWSASLTAIVIVRQRGDLKILPVNGKKTVAVVAIFLFMMPLFAARCVSAINYSRIGVFTQTVSAMPSHMQFLKNMASIDTGEAPIRYVPITTKARSLAYAVSPSLDSIREIIESPSNIHKAASRDNGIKDGEIGAGWIWHAFTVALAQRESANQIADLNDTYKQFNDDLEAAFSSGVLKKRFVSHPFLTESFWDVFKRTVQASWVVAAKSFQAWPYIAESGYQKDLFDEITLRRSTLVRTGYSHQIQGWVFADAPNKKVNSVLVSGPDAVENFSVSYARRPDVELEFKRRNGWSPYVIGFNGQFESKSTSAPTLTYVLDDGSKITNSANLVEGAVSDVFGDDSVKLVQGVDYVTHEHRGRGGWRHAWQSQLVNISNGSLVPKSLVLMLMLSLVISALIVRGDTYKRSLWRFAAFVAFLYAMRVMFYSVIEAEAWAVEIRYMLTANVMGSIALSLFVAGIFSRPATPFTARKSYGYGLSPHFDREADLARGN
jgi:hypothetical protein